MPFRPPKKKQRFADLKGILAQSGQQDNALYQTIQAMIERLDDYQDYVTVEDNRIIENEGGLVIQNTANKFASYHTKEDETSKLPNSVQLLAGLGIVFDDTVANKRTINATALHYDCPLSDGDTLAADLIFADGECIIVQVPV